MMLQIEEYARRKLATEKSRVAGHHPGLAEAQRLEELFVVAKVAICYTKGGEQQHEGKEHYAGIQVKPSDQATQDQFSNGPCQ